MKKEVLAVLILIILCPLVAAELTPDAIYLSDMLRMQTSLSSFLTLKQKGGGVPEVSYIGATLMFFPQNDDRQHVAYLETRPAARSVDNGLQFVWVNPQESKLDYALTSTVQTENDFKHVRTKILFPIRALPSAVLPYVQSTLNIDAVNIEIMRQARDLARGEDDLFVVVSKIALWVKNNVKYSLTSMTEEVSQPASWVIKNRIGACDELTSLFAALLRALGIPVKFVSGLAYSNSPLTPQNWGPHGWAEVYFPDVGWIPFDPTFGEFGWIDTGHIKMKDGVDPLEPSTRFEWRAQTTDVQTHPMEFATNVLEFGHPAAPFIKITSKILKPKVGFGSWNLIEADIENLKDYYLTENVALEKVPELQTVDALSKQIILKPFEKQKIFWSVHVSLTLDPDYGYTIPALVYTLRNETAKTQFVAVARAPVYSEDEIAQYVQQFNTTEKKNGTVQIGLACSSEKPVYQPAEPVQVSCKVFNYGGFVSALNLCAEKCYTLSLSSGEQRTINFIFNNTQIGSHDTVIVAENTDFRQIIPVSYAISDVPQLDIADMTLLKEILFDQKKHLYFTLAKTSFTSPKNVHVTIQSGNHVQDMHFDSIDTDIPFVFVIEGNTFKSGNNKMPITVAFEDDNHHHYSVKKEVSINLVNVTFVQRSQMLVRDVKEFFGMNT